MWSYKKGNIYQILDCDFGNVDLVKLNIYNIPCVYSYCKVKKGDILLALENKSEEYYYAKLLRNSVNKKDLLVTDKWGMEIGYKFLLNEKIVYLPKISIKYFDGKIKKLNERQGSWIRDLFCKF